MDCIDCHNRPTHIYKAPLHSVNVAMSTGRIDPRIPFIKKEAVAALAAEYATTEQALEGITKALRGFYESKHAGFAKANSAMLDQAISEVRKIYTENFFPSMKVDWRVYADNIGHFNFRGCYRCHDGTLVEPGGKTITSECNACHTIIAQGPGSKPETISAAGLEFKHPVDIGDSWKTTACSDCHTGAQ
jgi:hypothetical protein